MVWFLEHQAAELVVVHCNGYDCIWVSSMTDVTSNIFRASKNPDLAPQ